MLVAGYAGFGPTRCGERMGMPSLASHIQVLAIENRACYRSLKRDQQWPNRSRKT